MSFVLGLRCHECAADYSPENVAKPSHIDARLQDFDALYDQLTEASAAPAVGSNRLA